MRKMKKLVLMFAVMVAVCAASCNGNAEKVATENDSTVDSTLVVDSTAVDSVVTDSVAK